MCFHNKWLAFRQDGTPGYRWPAFVADSYANAWTYRGDVADLEMGALLALKPNFPSAFSKLNQQKFWLVHWSITVPTFVMLPAGMLTILRLSGVPRDACSRNLSSIGAFHSLWLTWHIRGVKTSRLSSKTCTSLTIIIHIRLVVAARRANHWPHLWPNHQTVLNTSPWNKTG